MFLGVRAVLVKSFARIHRDNLINFGILPLTLENPADYDRLALGDELELPDVQREVASGETVTVRAKGLTLKARHQVSARQREVILAGGKLNHAKAHGAASGKKAGAARENVSLAPQKPKQMRRTGRPK
jgi:aconitate hydratase